MWGSLDLSLIIFLSGLLSLSLSLSRARAFSLSFSLSRLLSLSLSFSISLRFSLCRVEHLEIQGGEGREKAKRRRERRQLVVRDLRASNFSQRSGGIDFWSTLDIGSI